MATGKQGKKSGKGGKAGSSKLKSGKKKRGGARKPKPLVVPQEPIIIGGGGSIGIGFPKTFKAIIGGPPNKHGFKNSDVDLVRLVVLDSGGGELHRMDLNDDDTVVICYTGSLCI